MQRSLDGPRPQNVGNDLAYDYANEYGNYEADGSGEGRCDFFCQMALFGNHVQQTVHDVLSSTECIDRLVTSMELLSRRSSTMGSAQQPNMLGIHCIIILVCRKHNS